MAEHKRGKMKNISGGVSDLICATNIFPLTRHVWPGPLQRVSCKKKCGVKRTVAYFASVKEGTLLPPTKKKKETILFDLEKRELQKKNPPP